MEGLDGGSGLLSVSASLLVNVRVMKGRRWFLNDATLLMNAIHIITYYKFVVVDLGF